MQNFYLTQNSSDKRKIHLMAACQDYPIDNSLCKIYQLMLISNDTDIALSVFPYLELTYS